MTHSLDGPCLTNLMTRQSISQTAVYLGRLTEVDSRHQWLFPQLKVTCSTTITRVRFVGEELDRGDENPELQIWRKQSPTSSRYSKIHHTNRANVVSMERLHLYATAVSWQVQAGDVFGVYQPNVRRSRYNFGMQERGSGQTSYVLTNQRQAPRVFDISRYDENGHQYPLVNVVAGKCACRIICKHHTHVAINKKKHFNICRRQ